MKKKKLQNGYIAIYIPEHPKAKKGWYSEHRYNVEQKIGRILVSRECVHHLDEDKTNNDIDNLMFFFNSREHSRFHNKIRRFGMTNPIKREIKERWIKLGVNADNAKDLEN